MFTIHETAVFKRLAADIWDEDERLDFASWLAANPEAGAVVKATNGVRKVRWSRAGMGKRGGARILYFARDSEGELVLMLIYTKAKFDTIPASTLRKMKEALDG